MAVEADPAAFPGDRSLADQPGVAAGHSLVERDARRLRPAALGYIVLALLQAIALARYPHRFEWGSASGIIYLVFLGTMLLTGAAGLASLAMRDDRAR
jgi:hypothetical protein